MKRGKLIPMIALLLCVTAAAATPAAGAGEPGATDGLPLVSSAWVYKEPRADSGVVGQITQWNVYVIQETKSGWTRVALPEGGSGWTPETAIDYAPAITPEARAAGLRRAVVLCEGLSLRESPSGNAKRLVLMPNGSHGYIIEERDGWLLVQYYAYSKSKGARQYTGWISQEYTMESPAYIHLKRRTQVYAFASSYAPVVGQTLTGQRLAVIGEVDDYYVVNLRSASGFIRKTAGMWSERQVIEGL